MLNAAGTNAGWMGQHGWPNVARTNIAGPKNSQVALKARTRQWARTEGAIGPSILIDVGTLGGDPKGIKTGFKYDVVYKQAL